MTKGADYDRLLAEFLAAGGDLSRCPFDAEGYTYEAPPYGSVVSGGGATARDLAEWEREYEEIVGRKK
jgi:hypothetical protein